MALTAVVGLATAVPALAAPRDGSPHPMGPVEGPSQAAQETE
jgi:hypothetical protein